MRDTLFSTDAGKATVHTVTVNRRARLVRALAIATMAPVILWALGRLSTAAFNNTLGRSGSFATEPALQHVVWGARSLVAPFGYAAHRGCCRLDGAVRGATADAVTGDPANGPIGAWAPSAVGIGKAVPR